MSATVSLPVCGHRHEPTTRCPECDALQQMGVQFATASAQQARLSRELLLRERAPIPVMWQQQAGPRSIVRAAPPPIPAGAVYVPSPGLSHREEETITRMVEGLPGRTQADCIYPQDLDFSDVAPEQRTPTWSPTSVGEPDPVRRHERNSVAQHRTQPLNTTQGIDQRARADHTPGNTANRSHGTSNPAAGPSQRMPHCRVQAIAQQLPSSFVPAQRPPGPGHIGSLAGRSARGSRCGLSQSATSHIGERSSSGEDSSN